MLPIISNEHFTARLASEFHGILQPPKHFVSTLIILTNFLAPQTRVSWVASWLAVFAWNAVGLKIFDDLLRVLRFEMEKILRQLLELDF